MKMTNYLLSTLHEIPKNTETISHQLMLRAGMIRKLASGLYTWLPTGYRILQKIVKIIKKEMNLLGALEICLPLIHPKKLWDQSKRTELYGNELLKFSNRRKKKFILGPTHEEVITKILKNEIFSIQQLPLILFQIQKKFRDEIRPRFGVLRTIEFLMKDAYSFHTDLKSLQNTYQKISDTYIKILKKLKIEFRIVASTSKTMGGFISHEFHAFSNSGEDILACSTHTKYAEHLKNAPVIYKKKSSLKSEKKKHITKIIQTIYIKTKKKSIYKYAIFLLKVKHNLNFKKIEKISHLEKPIFLLKKPLDLTNEVSILRNTKKLKILLIGDLTIKNCKFYTLFSQIKNLKYTPIFWNHDFKNINFFDIRNVTNQDYSPDGIGKITLKNSIEIGHIFQLGTKYSKIFQVSLSNKTKQKNFLNMGCYGIGINRIIAAIIEQHYDEKGIIWPEIIAPFTLAIAPINMHKNKEIKKITYLLYQTFLIQKIEVILDNRIKNIGYMLKDLELMGIPNILIISKNTIQKKKIEFYSRKNNKKTLISIKDILKNFNEIKKKLNQNNIN
ncbi:Proline--tRNA ligase [Buchnera aphidicola (Tuberolachnus salignus)]|uniref:Proline--tRNA ligase n=1 Tax=Buchnera aphidicola subsp. Tuberolachnus salignus TaxID=98804 RepID=A0A160SWX0_BUCTT|nr:proline--tRNA ligase [Buchnera aphidicola]CUR53138.1 Proline--tRNA ligase [Buchnera aphidicola (Tuberolachnus salignus)]